MCCDTNASSNLVGTEDCRNTLISCGAHDEGLTLLALSNLPLVVGRGSLIIGDRGDLFTGLELVIGGECGITMDGKIDFVTVWDLVSLTVVKGSGWVAFARELLFFGLR